MGTYEKKSRWQQLISILEFLIAGSLIVCSSSIYSLVYPAKYIYAVVLVLLCLAITVELMTNRVSVNELSLLLLRVMVYVILLGIYYLYAASVYSEFDRVTYMLVIMLFALFVIYLGIKNSQEHTIINGVIDKVYLLVVVLAIVSIVCWLLISVLRIIPTTGETEYFWGGYRSTENFLKIYFESQTYNFMGINIFRNSGIYPEAPMYAFVLIIALTYGYFVRKDHSRKTVYLLVAMFTTLSTTAVVVALFVILWYFLKKIRGNKYELILRTFIPILLLVVVYIFIVILNFKSSNDTLSTSLRADDFRAGYYAWLLHPFMGSGLDNLASIQQFMAAERFYMYMGMNQAWYSLGWSAMLAYGGIYLTALYAYPMIKVLVMGIKYKNEIWIFSLVVIAILFILIVYGSLLLVFILAWFLVISNKATFCQKLT